MNLVESNIRGILSTAQKNFKEARESPVKALGPLRRAFQALSPLFRQIGLSGYIFAMQLPNPLVKYFLTGGNASLMRNTHIYAHGRMAFKLRDLADSMASTSGPSLAESKTETPNGETYPSTIKYDGDLANIMGPAGYYREGAARSTWRKSPETEDWLNEHGHGVEGRPGVFKAPVTVFWGEQDIALEQAICLQGISEFITADSQVVLLPQSGHFTPIEVESRAALLRTTQWFIDGEQGEAGAAIKKVYPTAQVLAQK